jgi:hypothetical protein
MRLAPGADLTPLKVGAVFALPSELVVKSS